MVSQVMRLMYETPELEAVAMVAEALGLSEYALFVVAYRAWFGHDPNTRYVEDQFGGYLNSGKPPFYVRHFVRGFVDQYPECQYARCDQRRRQARAGWVTGIALIVAVAVALALG